VSEAAPNPEPDGELPFHSILFDAPNAVVEPDQPAFFADLNLDQVVEAVTAGRAEYDLAPFFHTRLRTVEAITYRHEILRDLADRALAESVDSFAGQMRAMREHLAEASRLHCERQRESWFLDAVAIYCDAVTSLLDGLTRAALRSRGLRAFRGYLAGYAASAAFARLRSETGRLKDQLGGIRYCLHIRDNRITVSRYDGEADYSADVTATFERFKQGAAADYRVRFHDLMDMNHVEAGILDLVAELYPEIFADLRGYAERRRGYLDPAVAAFDREVQFYTAYREFIAPLRASGLTFCYPEVSAGSKDVLGRSVFDVALAAKLVPQRLPVVTNDFGLNGPERIFVVSGPNQGGKTTFARTFGQMHYLASIGVPVPGSRARMFLFDQMFTHFERGENLQDLRGKLEDDLTRVHAILARATPASVVIVNEIFTSTALQDAVFLGTRVLEQIIGLDLLGVCVTFVDELASLGPATVSMVAAVAPDNPAERTYKLVRRPADGLAYAVAIAEKYGLTYDRLRERVSR
jgi:DNA mismatch repair protein MutS